MEEGSAMASCSWCGSATVVDGSVCPRSIACPACHARPGTRCKRPSGHEAAMHTDRWRRAEALDAEDGVTHTGLRAGSRR